MNFDIPVGSLQPSFDSASFPLKDIGICWRSHYSVRGQKSFSRGTFGPNRLGLFGERLANSVYTSWQTHRLHRSRYNLYRFTLEIQR